MSRRLSNLSFLLFNYSVFLQIVGVSLFHTLFMQVKHRLLLLSAIGSYPLHYFLFANIIMSLFNLSFQTLLLGRTSSVIILSAYYIISNAFPMAFKYLRRIEDKKEE